VEHDKEVRMTQMETGAQVVGHEPVPRLRRSRADKVVAGVCGGLGRYFGADPIWFRVAFVVLAVGGGSGVLLYLVAWLLVPEERPDERAVSGTASLDRHGPAVAGLALVVVGLMLLADAVVPWFDRVLWPLLVVAAGLGLLYTGSRHVGNR
jgi:phage shock protein C